MSRQPYAPSGVFKKIDELAATSETVARFREAAQILSAEIQQEAADLRREPLTQRIESFSGQESSVPSYALSVLKRIGQVKVLFLTERRAPIGEREAARLLELKVKRGGPEKLRYIQETVSALLGVEIDAFRSEGQKSPGEPEAELDVGRFLVQVNGAGIREALRLVLDYEFEQPSILLVEEPEIHLHPALETSMMRYLKAIGKESQILITTHSTNFLDTAEMRNVYLASNTGSTSIQLINLSEAESVVPRELGIRLSSLFMFDRLVFVEGPSDEDVFREMASALEINLAQSNVGFIPMGGVRNLAHFATEQTITFLTKRRVRIWFVLDRDERDEPEIRRLAAQIGDQARLVVLERRELENYLVVPRALVEFIKLKRQLAGDSTASSPSLNQVNQAVEKCLEGLKDIAIERRIVKTACGPVYPDREKVLDGASGRGIVERLSNELSRLRQDLERKEGELASLVEEETRVVNEGWQTRRGSLVPGDLLLDNVCKEFGVRFHKDRDSLRLARVLTPNEINEEIKDLLGEIGAPE